MTSDIPFWTCGSIHVYTFPLGAINTVAVEYGLLQDHLACANPRVNNLSVRITETDEAKEDEEAMGTEEVHSRHMLPLYRNQNKMSFRMMTSSSLHQCQNSVARRNLEDVSIECADSFY